MQGCDAATDRVVEQRRADASGHRELERVIGAEERLVLPDRIALVVEDGPAARRPARVDDRAAVVHRSGLGLRLDLDDRGRSRRSRPDSPESHCARRSPDRRRVFLARERPHTAAHRAGGISFRRRWCGSSRCPEDRRRSFLGDRRRTHRICACVSSLSNPSTESPIAMSAPPATIPSTSNAAAVRLPFASTTAAGARSR